MAFDHLWATGIRTMKVIRCLDVSLKVFILDEKICGLVQAALNYIEKSSCF